MKTLIKGFLLQEQDHILKALESIIDDGGRSVLPEQVKIEPYSFYDGISGYHYYLNDELIGSINLAISQIGTFVLKREFTEGEEVISRVDNYAADGRFLFSEPKMTAYVLYVDYLNFDHERPLVNHLYNTLSYQYRQTIKGNALTQIMFLIEKIFRELQNSSIITLNIEKKAQDPAIKDFARRYQEIEMDSVLTWKEKRISKEKIQEDEQTVIKTLVRVHQLSFFNYKFFIIFSRFLLQLSFLAKNPVQNFKGYLNRYTIGVMAWFLGMVKNNIGYSIALAVYAPFTFFFITQPMNPHAMWMVGKVRNAYLNVVSEFETKTEQFDQIQTKNAAIDKSGSNSYLSNTSWIDRMSAFKSMEIGLEKNMIVAERMGRIEQLETNFNFPLIAEQAFQEIERYQKQVELTLKFNKEISSSYRSFLQDDLELAQQNKVYTWKKLYQFFVDHPFILMDQSNEHKEKSYYLGRSFIAFEKMTQKLLREKTNLPDNEDTMRLKQLAQNFLDMRKDVGNVVGNIENNSRFYIANEPIDSDRLRDHMKRQWEIIYLQQNKRQESATAGLQSYVWSVRQALWVLQSFYANKKEEHNTLNFRFSNQTKDPENVTLDESIDETYESLFHILTYEFASIKKEMMDNLPGDDEVQVREVIIRNIKNNLIKRDRLLNRSKEIARAPEGTSNQ